MLIKRGLLASMAVALTVVAVGCGGSDNKSNSTSVPAASTSTSGSGGGAAPSNAQVQAAVTACKNSVNSNPQVPANIKGDLERICEKAAGGDPAEMKKATKEVCLKIVNATVPSAAKDQAKAACDAAGG